MESRNEVRLVGRVHAGVYQSGRGPYKFWLVTGAIRHQVVAWSALAEAVVELRPGDFVEVQGTLTYRNNGTNTHTAEIVAKTVRRLAEAAPLTPQAYSEVGNG